MKITISIDEKLINKAVKITGLQDTSLIVEEALETLIRVETGKKLSKLGGKE